MSTVPRPRRMIAIVAAAVWLPVAGAIVAGCRAADRCCVATDFEDPSAPLAPENGPGIVLSFDDAHVDAWYAAADVLEAHGAVATFFVTRFDYLDPEQVEELRELEARGHEIGCHGHRHQPSGQYARQNGVDAWIEDDVLPALDAMAAEGFEPVSFAFPYGEHTQETGDAALEHFRHIRGSHFVGPLPAVREQDRVFIPAEELPRRRFSCAFAIDERYGIGADKLDAGLDRALEGGEVMAVYAHEPVAEPEEGLQVDLDLLEHLVSGAAERGMTFYRYRDFAAVPEE